MPSVPAGVIIAWPSTAASIPAGWTRVTALDGQYPRSITGAAAPGGTGGSATHTHVSSAHAHGLPAHTHTVSNLGSANLQKASGQSGSGVTGSVNTHGHTVPTLGSGGAETTGSLTPTWNTASNDPAFQTVIWIQSDGTPTGIPTGALVYFAAATLPSGFTGATGAVYLKGAAAAGNGGGTGGSNATHAHTAVAHSHGATPGHSHSAGSSGGTNQTVAVNSGTDAVSDGVHTHALTVSTSTVTVTSVASANSDVVSGEPPFYTLFGGTNSSFSGIPLGMIALWTGSLATIPAQWYLCDGTNGTPNLSGSFIKTATTGADVGITGGSVGHTHTAPAGHTHTNSHNHSVPVTSASGSVNTVAAGAFNFAQASHAHGTNTSAGGSAITSDSQVQTVTAVTDATPPHTTVAYIMYAGNLTPVITAPTANQAFSALPITVSWTIDAGQTQLSYELTVTQGGVTVYDSGSVTSSTQSTTIPNTSGLVGGQTYVVQVSVISTTSLNGVSAGVTFTLTLNPPPTPTLVVTADSANGRVSLAATSGTPTGGQDPTATWDFYRRQTGTTAWTRIITGVAAGTAGSTTTVYDYTARDEMAYDYKATAVTASGGRTDSSTGSGTITLDGIWLHCLSDPAGTIHHFMWDSGQRNERHSIPSSALVVEGRTHPIVEMHATEMSEGVTVDLMLYIDHYNPRGSYDYDALLVIYNKRDVICYRDHRSRKVFGTLPDLAINDEHMAYSTSLSIQAIDFTEAV